MKIAIVGIGNVGGTLARRWGQLGHSISLGVQDPSAHSASDLAKEIGPVASVHSVSDAVKRSEIVVLATPWPAVRSLAESLSPLLRGKLVIDCTNPLKKDLSGLEVGFEASGAELLQSWAPGSFVFKAFNTVGFNIMADPVLEGRKTVMFFCGNEPSRRGHVRELVESIGFEAVDVGSLSSARLLEPWALLWIQSAYRHGLGREFGFSIVRKK